MSQPLDFVIRVRDDGTATVQRFSKTVQGATGAVGSFAPTFTRAFGPVTSGFAGLASGAASFGSRAVGAFRGVTAAAGRIAGSVFNIQNAMVGLVAASGIQKIVTTFGSFEQQMNRVRAVSGATAAEFTALETKAKQLGESTKFSATEVADAQAFLAQAGFKTDQILGSLEGTLNLAAAAQLDLGTSADIVSNILAGLQLPVSELGRANDTLVKTFTSTNTNLQQLGEAFKFVGPVISSAGVDFEEASAAIGLLGNAGIQGSLAGTALRGAITRLLNPTSEAAAILKKLGVQATTSTGDLQPLNKIIDQLQKSGATTAEIMEVFGQRAGPGMATLVAQGGDALRKLTGELKNAGGTTDKIAAVQLEGLYGALTKAKSAIEGTVIALGEQLSPTLIDFAGYVGDAARSFTEFIKTTAENRVVEETLATAKIGALALKQEFLILSQTAVDAFLHVREGGLTFFADITSTASQFFRLYAEDLDTFFLEPTRDTLKQLVGGFFAFTIAVNTQFGLVFDTIVLSLRDVADKVGEFAQSIGDKIARVPGFGALGEQIRNTGVDFRVAGRVIVRELGDVEQRNAALVTANRDVQKSLESLIPTAGDAASGLAEISAQFSAAAKDGGVFGEASATLGAEISTTNQELLQSVVRLRQMKAEIEAARREREAAAAAPPEPAAAVAPPTLRAPTVVEEEPGAGGAAEAAAQTGAPRTGGILDFFAQGDTSALADQTNTLRQTFSERSQILASYQAEAQRITELQTAVEQSEGQKRVKAQKQLDAALVKQDQTKRKLLTSGASALFGALQSLSQSGGEKIFNIAKGFAIADATINAFRAANQALGSAPPPLNVILAAAALAQGLATVRQIKATTPGGGGGGGGASIAATAAVGAAAPAPSVPQIPESIAPELADPVTMAPRRSLQVVIQGNVLGEVEFVRERLGPAFREAFEDNTDFGLKVEVGRT